ncbi:MAG: hypothetical protein Q8J64_08070 [Thermodesulfovibrionales bacterium]|nr:hypothetical protein [Thermodesulfovibrionales bacterium]
MLKKPPSPPLSECFPTVAGIVIKMTYYRKRANPILMLRTVNILPVDEACFNMNCMIKGCSDGGFDLTSVVSKMVMSRKGAAKGKLSCLGHGDVLDPAEHASVEYEIGVRYKRLR